MVEASPRRRLTVANVALTTAALVALVAAGFAVSRSAEQAESPADPQVNVATSAPPGDVDTMITRLEYRLKDDPSDVAGWRMLGWSRLQTGSVPEAVAAYERAAKLAPDDAATWAALGEAYLADAKTAQASTALARAIALDPKEPSASYSLASLKEQSGDRKGAVEAWLAMLDDAPPDAEYAAEVRAKAVSVAAEIGMDISARLPVAPSATLGPTTQQMASASALPAGEQQAMIDGMVARLDDRLAANPRDVDGWTRLMRARMVLGQGEAATAALKSGLAAFADDPAVQARLRASAAELGVPR